MNVENERFHRFPYLELLLMEIYQIHLQNEGEHHKRLKVELFQGCRFHMRDVEVTFCTSRI